MASHLQVRAASHPENFFWPYLNLKFFKPCWLIMLLCLIFTLCLHCLRCFGRTVRGPHYSGNTLRSVHGEAQRGVYHAGGQGSGRRPRSGLCSGPVEDGASSQQKEGMVYLVLD